MKKSQLKLPGKNRAQAMVEFMLALPLLLLLIYGTIEVGRLIFIFSSVANASREAARYGSTTGEIDNVAFYQNCDGIRDAANESAFIVPFNEINITYDRGVNEHGEQIPISDIDPDPEANTCPIDEDMIRNGDRIIVQVSAHYEPIISIIPIDPLEIVSASAHTFLVSIPIVGSAMPTMFFAETSTPSRTPTIITPTFPPTLAFTSTATHLPLPGRTPTSIVPVDTIPPTITFTPTNTSLPTYTPSITSTPISCSGLTGVSHGPLTIDGNIMKMQITNNSGHVLSTAEIYLEWNHDTGHRSVSDPSLHLRRINIAGQTWIGDIQTPSAYIPAFYPFIPTGESTIQFRFHQDYDLTDGTERIIINLSTPGCVNYPVDSRN